MTQRLRLEPEALLLLLLLLLMMQLLLLLLLLGLLLLLLLLLLSSLLLPPLGFRVAGSEAQLVVAKLSGCCCWLEGKLFALMRAGRTWALCWGSEKPTEGVE